MLAVFVIGTVARYFRQARHFTMRAARSEVRRGETIDISLNIADPGKVKGRVEVGVRCVERYAYRDPRPGGATACAFAKRSRSPVGSPPTGR